MKKTILILFLLPFFAYSQNQGRVYLERISEEDKKDFNAFKSQIIHSLQKNIVQEVGFDRFNNIVERNRDLLTRNSIQGLLNEFLRSDEFHWLSLDAVSIKPVVLLGMAAFLIYSGLRTFYALDYFLGGSLYSYEGFFSLIITGASIVISVGIVIVTGVLILEEITDRFVISKFRLLEDPRPGLMSRTMSTCKKIFSEMRFK